MNTIVWTRPMRTFKPMNPEVKAAWIAKLRGGGIIQNTDRLYYKLDDSYCCLGVLQKLVLGISVARQPENTCLSRRAAKEAGLPSVHKYKDYDDIPTTNPQKVLAQMNYKGKTFAKIADWIEENL